MKTIGIGELQKNTSIINNLTEAMEVIDKRRKRAIALILPIQSKTVVSQLAGKYRQRVPDNPVDLTLAKEIAMNKALEEKYGFIN